MGKVAKRLINVSVVASIAITVPIIGVNSAYATSYELQTKRVSVAGTESNPTQLDGQSINYTGRSLSSTGRYVAFESTATNLVLGDSNGKRDIFVQDRQTHTTTRVSEGGTSGSPLEANNDSSNASISDDGRYVVFESSATNLVGVDTNLKSDIFVHDRQTHTTTRVSEGGTSGSPLEADDHSSDPAISADGKVVAFMSDATNLVIGDTNALTDIFTMDLQTHTTTRVSEGGTSGSPLEADDVSDFPVLSADGRYVAFTSNATNLVVGDTNAKYDAFRFDRQNHSIIRVSEGGTSGSPVDIDDNADSASISADGSMIAFFTAATNLVIGDTNAAVDSFVFRVSDHTTTRVSEGGTSGSPVQSNGASDLVRLSADGRYAVYRSNATNLAGVDTNSVADIFLFDIQNHVTTRVSDGGTPSSPYQSNGISSNPNISADGSMIAYDSAATNLVIGDTNGYSDVFVAMSTVGEDSGPNGGDANNDGTVDAAQAKVASFMNGVAGKYTVVETAGCGAVSDYSAVDEPSAHEDVNYSYPAGVAKFTATGCATGGTESFTVYFYGSYDIGSLKLRKFNSVNNTYADVPSAVLSAVTIGGQSAVKAVYSVTDGGALDEDATANGTIVDPVGIATSLSAATSATAPNTGVPAADTRLQALALVSGVILLGLSVRRIASTLFWQ